MDALVTSLGTGVTSMVDTALSGVGAIAPKVFPILGCLILIRVVKKVITAFC